MAFNKYQNLEIYVPGLDPKLIFPFTSNTLLEIYPPLYIPPTEYTQLVSSTLDISSDIIKSTTKSFLGSVQLTSLLSSGRLKLISTSLKLVGAISRQSIVEKVISINLSNSILIGRLKVIVSNMILAANSSKSIIKNIGSSIGLYANTIKGRLKEITSQLSLVSSTIAGRLKTIVTSLSVSSMVSIGSKLRKKLHTIIKTFNSKTRIGRRE